MKREIGSFVRFPLFDLGSRIVLRTSLAAVGGNLGSCYISNLNRAQSLSIPVKPRTLLSRFSRTCNRACLALVCLRCVVVSIALLSVQLTYISAHAHETPGGLIKQIQDLATSIKAYDGTPPSKPELLEEISKLEVVLDEVQQTAPNVQAVNVMARLQGILDGGKVSNLDQKVQAALTQLQAKIDSFLSDDLKLTLIDRAGQLSALISKPQTLPTGNKPLVKALKGLRSKIGGVTWAHDPVQHTVTLSRELTKLLMNGGLPKSNAALLGELSKLVAALNGFETPVAVSKILDIVTVTAGDLRHGHLCRSDAVTAKFKSDCFWRQPVKPDGTPDATKQMEKIKTDRCVISSQSAKVATICGFNPAPQGVRSFKVKYTCGGNEQPPVTFREGSEIVLLCD